MEEWRDSARTKRGQKHTLVPYGAVVPRGMLREAA